MKNKQSKYRLHVKEIDFILYSIYSVAKEMPDATKRFCDENGINISIVKQLVSKLGRCKYVPSAIKPQADLQKQSDLEKIQLENANILVQQKYGTNACLERVEIGSKTKYRFVNVEIIKNFKWPFKSVDKAMNCLIHHERGWINNCPK